MKSIYLAVGIFLSSSILYSQNYNLTEVGYLDITGTRGTNASDIWGWVDSEGNEYAIIGLNNGTSIIDVTDPSNPEEVFFEPGTNSIWRDIKTWNNHAYVTTEAKEGLLIIDLSTLPADRNLTTTYYTPSGTTNGFDLSAHNLFIDESGICYLFGANKGVGGVLMLDLFDPKNPVEVGIENSFYVHDGVVKNDTLLSANINNGFLSMWDVSDKSNPLFLGSVTTPNSFTHNVWFSDDLKYAYTTDEVSGAFLTEYNIQDPSDITETDRIRTTVSKDVIPHNTHFINNFIVTSYYRDGVIIHDVSDKGNMIEVARFDTSPAFSGSGFNGCWGVYPWLPSCNIIAADIENGLYILKPAVELNVCGLLDTIEFPNSPISIYPSPFQDELRVAGSVNKTHTLTLYNVLGEIVLEANLWYFKVKLPMDMPAGIYTAKITQGEKLITTQKVIKN